MNRTTLSLFGDNHFLQEITLACIERIIINYDQIISIINKPSHKDSANIKILHFIHCLKLQFNSLLKGIENYKSSMDQTSKQKQIDNIISLFDVIVKLREELAILPKQEEPIELYRFLRIFNRYGIADQDSEGSEDLSDDKPANFVIYSGQVRGATTYSNTPLEGYETQDLNAVIRDIFGAINTDLPQTGSGAYHISVPREETRAPLYWPTLAHEIGHQVMELTQFKGQQIEQAFSKYLGDQEGDKYIPPFRTLINLIQNKQTSGPKQCLSKILRSWLTECWCDIYAYFATGPAFIFTQRNIFLSICNKRQDDIGSESHPPYYLRLLLLQEILRNHQSIDPFPIDPLDLSLSNLLLSDDPEIQHCIFEIAQWFLTFFNAHFKMEGNDTESLQKHVKKLKERSTIFNTLTLNNLVDSLSQGYPIPSLPVNDDLIYEKETSVHEIMLAAWISYLNGTTKEVSDFLNDNFDDLCSSNIDGQWSFFIEKLSPIYERFNQSVLRSLQISEWVSFLKPSADSLTESSSKPSLGTSRDHSEETPAALLVDREIKHLLRKGELKVIPLVHLTEQLGSTSLDVRLGPTFQTYQPNQSGVIDFTDKESVENVHANSSIIDLDFNESIVLAPGQFVLAHTMEYIGLPEGVAAQIEGRSSFARLGIQVHMTASLIDPGFQGSVTFEVFNAGPNPIRLFPGYRIGQLRFFRCTTPDKPYNKNIKAKYKGLLIYSNSLLAKDYEIERFSENQKKRQSSFVFPCTKTHTSIVG